MYRNLRRLSARLKNSCRCLSTSSRSSKIYEFRTYAIQPSKMRESVKVMEEIVPVRQKHSKLNGAWYTELGGLNEVNFIWEYDDYSHRTAVRKALAENEEWRDHCLPKLLPLLISQTNMLLRPFPSYEPQLEPVKGYGVYTLARYDVKPGLLDQFMKVPEDSVKVRQALDYPKPMGVWFSEFGRRHSVFTLNPHVSFEEREKFMAEATKDEFKSAFVEGAKLCNEISVKAMVPASFSPLQ